MSGEPRYAYHSSGLVSCEDCGSIITDRDAHTRFHAVLGDHGRAVAMLLVAHIGPKPHDKYDVKDRFDAGRNENNWSAEAFSEVVNRGGRRVPAEPGVDTSGPNDHGIVRRLP